MCAKDRAPEGLFTFGAFVAVYLATDGFPRQIVQLCHQVLLAVIIKEKPRVTWGVVRGCMRWRNMGLPRRRRYAVPLTVVGLTLAMTVGFMLAAALGPHSWQQTVDALRNVSLAQLLTFQSEPKPASIPKANTGQDEPDRAQIQGQAFQGQPATAQGQPPQPQGQSSVAQPGPETPAQAQGDAAQAARLQAQSGPEGQTGEAQQNPPSGTPKFLGVELSRENEKTVLDILTDRPAARLECSVKPNPSRLVIDLIGKWDRQAHKELPTTDARVEKVRTALLPDRLRVVVYLKDQASRPGEPKPLRTARGLRLVLE